jgi:hypothetical protein
VAWLTRWDIMIMMDFLWYLNWELMQSNEWNFCGETDLAFVNFQLFFTFINERIVKHVKIEQQTVLTDTQTNQYQIEAITVSSRSTFMIHSTQENLKTA